ncbi:MAG: hypothetical protein P9M14_01070 [Candidatus Alcyoniella australis]|nr:hypothetical protein [Candidatus Alcyoniella australis]
MHVITLLQWPRMRQAHNALLFGSAIQRFKYSFFFLLTFAFQVGLGFGFYELFIKLLAIEIYGPILIEKLFYFAYMMFFAILVFSNILAALSSYFIADDLELVLTSPVDMEQLFHARLIDTMISSCWMVLLVAIPLLVSLGLAMDAPWHFYPWVPAILLAFIILPSVLGVLTTLFLVRIFPAKKAHDVLAILGVVFVVVLYFLFRFVRPEQLFDPAILEGFAEFVGSLRTEESLFMPPTWASQGVSAALAGNYREAGFLTAVSFSWGLFAALIGGEVARRIYFEGYSRAQEGSRARISGSRVAGGILERIAALYGEKYSALVLKDLKSFFRETVQWTQMLLLLALIVVYLFNFKVLDFSIYGVNAFSIRNIAGAVNFALAAFVISAVAVRFVVPQVSLEGSSFWLIKTSPLPMKRFVAAKFFSVAVPMTLLSLVLIVLSNHFLDTHAVVGWVTTGAMLVLTISVNAIGVGMGARYPDMQETNIARLAASPTSILYMLTCIALIGITVLVGIYPTYLLLSASLSHVMPSGVQLLLIVASYAWIVWLLLGVGLIFLQHGVRALENKEL